MLSDFISQIGGAQRAPSGGGAGRARTAPGQTRKGRREVGEVQKFLLDSGYNIGSKSGEPDYSWGRSSNKALQQFVTDNRDTEGAKGDVARALDKIMDDSRKFSLTDASVAAASMAEFAHVIRSGGAKQDLEGVQSPDLIRDVPIQGLVLSPGGKAINLQFPIFDAAQNLKSLNTVMLQEVVLPYMRANNMPFPRQWEDIDKKMVGDAISQVQLQVTEYITNVPGYNKDQALQQAMSVIRDRFNTLSARYMSATQEAEESDKHKIKDIIQRDLASLFMRVENQPELKGRMLDRAQWVMEQKGASDNKGNLRSWELYNANVGRVGRELMNWVENFGNKNWNAPTQQQAPQQPQSPITPRAPFDQQQRVTPSTSPAKPLPSGNVSAPFSPGQPMVSPHPTGEQPTGWRAPPRRR